VARNDERPAVAVSAHSAQFEARKSTHSTPGARELSFDVHGTPTPQGSKKAFARTNKATGKTTVSLVESAGDRLKEWREEVKVAAMVAKVEAEIPRFDGPVCVDVTFFLPRPKGHYGTGRNAGVLKDWAPLVPVTKPDGDKLLRAVCDALTSASVYLDDSQIVEHRSRKRFADDRAPGARIAVFEGNGFV